MENLLSFQNIETHSSKIEENEFYIQYSNSEIPDRYDSNYLKLKYSPTLEEFKLIEKIQQEYQQSMNQNHLKFSWPDNIGLHPEVLEYFDHNDYKIEMQNLYWVSKELFKVTKINPKLTIQTVNENNFDDFVTMNLEEDLHYGKSFYEHKKKMYPYQYQLENTSFLVAYLDRLPVGSLILIHSDSFIEIDNVLTISNYRGMQVASTLLTEVVQHIAKENQKVILVADAEDTPKEMYEKMGFQFVSYQISAQKTI